MAASDGLQRKEDRLCPESDGDESSIALVVLDAIADYCLNARQLAVENKLATISTLLERVLLEVGKRLSTLEKDAPPFPGPNEPPSSKIDDS